MGTKKVIRRTGPLAGLGERIKNARVAADTTQEDAAEEFGLTTRTIRRIEKGEYEPSMSLLVAMADFYEVTTDSLLYDAGERAA